MDRPHVCPLGVEHGVLHGCEVMEQRCPTEQGDGSRAHDDQGQRQHHYLYREGQLLISTADERLARERLAGIGVEVIDDQPDEPTRRRLQRLGFTRVRVDESRRPIPEIVTAIDRTDGPRVRPNQVMVSTFHFHVGPASPPREVAAEFSVPDPDVSARAGGRRATRVLVLDTGLIADEVVRGQLLRGRCEGDEEAIPPGPLPRNTGHGTFIAGLILKHTNHTTVQVRDVVDQCGYVDDLALAARLDDVPAEVDILNLSFGGHGFDGEMAATVTQLKALTFRNPKLVIVAAAGNDGTDLPFLPAALPGVIGVAAVERERSSGQWRRACFSNYGPWVDACAEGVDQVSAFLEYQGELEPTAPPHPCQGGAALAGAAGIRRFHRRASWSGTSFAAPLVTAAIAQRMKRRKLSAKRAAYDLLFAPDAWDRRLPGLGVPVVPPNL